MTRPLIYLTIKRIRRLHFLIQNETDRAKNAARSIPYEKNITRMKEKQKKLMNLQALLKNNELSFLKRCHLYVENMLFYYQDRLRKYREERAIIASDKQHIKDLIKKETDRPGDFYYDVDVQLVENEKTDVVGERKIIVKNKKNDIKKVYFAGASASNDWYIELASDIEKGLFEKTG